MTESTSTAVAVIPAESLYSNLAAFEDGQRIAKALTSSALVPEMYRGPDGLGNAMIALDMSRRMSGIPPLMVMQNLHVIEGRPSWSSQFIIAALNSCGKFSPLRFRIEDRGEQPVSYDEWSGPKGQRQKTVRTVKIKDKSCVAYAIEKATGEILEGPEMSIATAVAEGWYSRSGSKWVTMPDLMLRYRAAAFFGRLYAPDMLMGMSTVEEARETVIEDVDFTVVEPEPAALPEPEPGKPKRARGVAAAMAVAAKPVAREATATGRPREAIEVPADGVTREYTLAGDDGDEPYPDQGAEDGDVI